MLYSSPAIDQRAYGNAEPFPHNSCFLQAFHSGLKPTVVHICGQAPVVVKSFKVFVDAGSSRHGSCVAEDEFLVSGFALHVVFVCRFFVQRGLPSLPLAFDSGRCVFVGVASLSSSQCLSQACDGLIAFFFRI